MQKSLFNTLVIKDVKWADWTEIREIEMIELEGGLTQDPIKFTLS